MIVYNHALQNYLERVLNLEPGQAGGSVMQFAEEQIMLAARSPDIIYRRDQLDRELPGIEEDCPIHVRNGCAVPVKENDDNEEVFIPTAYAAITFLRKMKTHEPARARG